MKRKPLKRAFKKRVNLLKGYFLQDDLINNLEEIHRFRIAYKRTRAVLRLVVLEQSATKNPLKKGKRLYQQLGDIRNMQLFSQGIERYFGNIGIESSMYLTKLSKRILREKSKYSVLEKQISFDELYRSLEKFKIDKLHDEPIKNYVIAQIEILNKHLNHPTDEGIHVMRKVLKDFQYNAKLLQKVKGIEMPIIKDVQKLSEVTDLLGSYNDLRIGRAYLVSLSYKIPLEEQRILNQLKIEWLEKKKLQKGKVLTCIEHLLPKSR